MRRSSSTKGFWALLRAHGIRQTTNSGYDPATDGIAERTGWDRKRQGYSFVGGAWTTSQLLVVCLPVGSVCT